jgi:hypothetical protein
MNSKHQRRDIAVDRIAPAFQDYDGETVHEFEGEAVRTPLRPDESRGYEFRFENLPDRWPFRIPVVEVRRVGY